MGDLHLQDSFLEATECFSSCPWDSEGQGLDLFRKCELFETGLLLESSGDSASCQIEHFLLRKTAETD